MSSHPFTPWLALGQTTLAMFKQIGEAGTTGLKVAGGQIPASQGQLAQLIKSTLDMSRELNELQTSICISLLQTQLGTLNSSISAKTLRDLHDVHFDFVNNLCSQWKTTLGNVAERANSCMDDLRQAQTKDDVSFVMMGFLRDAGAKLHKEVEESGMLINSVSAAASVLTQRALDELIATPEQSPANE